MSLDKGIEHGKEKRKKYFGSKAIDKSCRNHGSCPWCMKNRKHKFRDKHIETMLFDIEEIHENATVQIWKNSVTGETSVGWWDNMEVNE